MMRFSLSLICADVVFCLACLTGEIIGKEFHLTHVPFWEILIIPFLLWMTAFSLTWKMISKYF